MKPKTHLPLALTLTALLCQAASAQVIISEFMADNKKVLLDEDFEASDWIELYNTGTTSVNLKGWSLTDDSNRVARWTIPQTNLPAKGFLIVFASGKNRSVPGAPLHTDFGLRASGEYLALLRPNGSVATEFSPTFPAQYADVSYGLAYDVVTNTLVAAGATAKVQIPANGNLGLLWTGVGFGDGNWRSGATGVGYETAVEGFAVYNYVANVGVWDIDVAKGVIDNPFQQSAVYSENAGTINYLNTGPSAHYGGDRTFPGFTIGAEQDNYVIEATATITIPAAGAWTFGVNSDDGFELTVGGNIISYPTGRGPEDSLGTFFFPAAGDYPLKLVFFENGGGSEVELFAAQGTFATWNQTSFRLVGDSANGGLTVKSPVVPGGEGSYRPLLLTDVQAEMKGVNASAYVRIPFTLTNASTVQSLTLNIKYDDGFVAYLNGSAVASRNAPAGPQWNSQATAPHPGSLARVYEEINLSDQLTRLQTGQNVLAIHGLNLSPNDTDFLILPELVDLRGTAGVNRYFSAPSPGRLNNNGAIARVADTKFSVDRGFFDVPFTLAITSATPGVAIRYTLDGSLPSEFNGTLYTGPFTIRSTTALRAAAFKDGFLPSNTDTETYIFVSDVGRQSPNGEPPPGWPDTWGANVVDYGMDPLVVYDPLYRAELTNALRSIPTFSLVTGLSNLFDSATGIYANANQQGPEWERPASLELVYPDGRKGFHINCGVRIRGGYSRSSANPKHAFRFFFRQEYGAGKLVYPLFANQNGADTFDGFDLRTMQNYSWSFEGDYRFIGLRDQWSRDTQYAMGHQTERGDFYHLYINGQYWGLYNTAERPEASFAESYYGGSKTNYDVIKVETQAGYNLVATDGNMDAWTRLWQSATNGFAKDADYFKVQGLNLDGTRNPAYENLLDVDNLIDYMLLAFFTGNIDAPVSAFLGNWSPNNLFSIRDRTGVRGGFRFVIHDSEHTLLHESSLGNNQELYRDRTQPYAAGDPNQQGPETALLKSNPHYFFTQLTANPEFRVRLADRIYLRFFNGGTLTTEACRAQLLTRSNEIYSAVVAESARWGDSKRTPARTRNVDWVKEMNRVYSNYFALRPGIVLNQFRTNGWWSDVAGPVFNRFGGLVTNGFRVTVSAPSGSIYYTRDGSDPRARGGSISPLAQFYSGPITINQSTRIRARALVGTTWSPACDATFYVIQNFTNLMISEVMYNPPATTNTASEEFEFIELKNTGTSNLELSGVHFTNGVRFTFPLGTFLAPGAFKVLVSNPVAFTNKYPRVRFDGIYDGRLSDNGETLTLNHVNASNIMTVKYETRPPWPTAADGLGFSLVSVNPNANPDPANPYNWRASSAIGGSPGTNDAPVTVPRILINEALTHTDPPQVDMVELYNPYSTNVDVGFWYLTDQRDVPKKFRIPAQKIVPANGFLVFTENDWFADPNSTNSFRLDSHGEEIYLYSADAAGNLTGYSDGFSFGSSANGVSFGRHVSSVGEIDYPAQQANSFGTANVGPKVGPVVINEIHYHPAAGGDEFLELKSITNAPVKLFNPLYPTNTWRVNGLAFVFPPNTELGPGRLMLLVATNPAAFRAKYTVPSEVQIIGPYAGGLQGGGEALSLQYPDDPDLDTNTGAIFIPHIDVDVVRYNDKAPWPTNADGWGPSLERLNSAAYGNDPANWRASLGPPSPGRDNIPNQSPTVNAGLDQTVTLPAAAALVGTASDDGLPVPPGTLTVTWTKLSGPDDVSFSDPASLSTTASFTQTGVYVLQLAADDGAVSVTDVVTITVVSSGSTGFPIESVGIVGGATPTMQFSFTAEAGHTYTVQYRSTVAGGAWLSLTNIPALPVTQTIQVTDPLSFSSDRFYRVVTPAQP
jgi:hypothetical protein